MKPGGCHIITYKFLLSIKAQTNMTIHGLLVKILVYQSPELRPRLLTLAQYPNIVISK